MRRLLIWLCALPLCTLAQAADPAPSRVADIVQLAPGVHLLPGRFERGRQPDGNSLIIEGREGLVVIDSGRHFEHTRALIAWAQLHKQQLVAVINSHWHLDHLGGNILLRREWPALQVHASAAVNAALADSMLRSATDLRAMLNDPQTDANMRQVVRIDLALLDQRALLAPSQLIDGPPQDLVLAGRRLRVGVEPGAVSGGDVWVLDPASGVLAVGDFVTLPVPFFDTACAPGWAAAMGRIEALPFTQLVPGHGPVMTRSDFARYRGALDSLLACAASDRPAATCSAGWMADLGPLLPAGQERVVNGMLGQYIANRLRAATEQRDRFCPRR